MRKPEQYLSKPVRSLQTMLRTIAKDTEKIPPVVPDGIFGSNTESALKAFQKLHNLPATGKTDPDTWRELSSSYSHAAIHSGPAAPLRIILQPNQVLSPGSRNEHVPIIQAMLHVIGQHYHNMPSVSMTGELDHETQLAIRALRRAASLPDSPEIDRRTWLYLTHLYRAAVQDGTGKSPF